MQIQTQVVGKLNVPIRYSSANLLPNCIIISSAHSDVLQVRLLSVANLYDRTFRKIRRLLNINMRTIQLILFEVTKEERIFDLCVRNTQKTVCYFCTTRATLKRFVIRAKFGAKIQIQNLLTRNLKYQKQKKQTLETKPLKSKCHKIGKLKSVQLNNNKPLLVVCTQQ